MSTPRTTLAAAALALTAALAGCGSGEQHAHDSTPSSPSSPGGTPSAGSYPTYAPSSYSYRLRVLCYCPVVGPVDVTVKDGQVASALVAAGAHKGEDAPAYTRKTINDLIAIANDPKSGDVEVTWPAGADAPTKIAVNPIRMAADAGVTYTIRDVSAE